MKKIFNDFCNKVEEKATQLENSASFFTIGKKKKASEIRQSLHCLKNSNNIINVFLENNQDNEKIPSFQNHTLNNTQQIDDPLHSLNIKKTVPTFYRYLLNYRVGNMDSIKKALNKRRYEINPFVLCYKPKADSLKNVEKWIQQTSGIKLK